MAEDRRPRQKTILVIAGDHGEGLGSHGEGTHGYFIYDDVLHVPFIIATPIDELRGIRVDAQVSLVDVFPTVLALGGHRLAGRLHGRSLVPLMSSRPARHAYAYGESMAPNLQYGWSPLHCLRSPRYKFIRAPTPELYDLTADPGELHNVFSAHRSRARVRCRQLDRLMAESSRGARAPEVANLDKDTIARLRRSATSEPTPAAEGTAASMPPHSPIRKTSSTSSSTCSVRAS